MDRKIIVGITLGDYNGIGAEVIIKTIQDDRIFKFCDIVIYGHKSILNYYAKNLKIQNLQLQEIKTIEKLNPKIANVITCWDEQVQIQMGTSTEDAGKKSMLCLQAAIDHLIKKEIDVLS